MMHVSQSHHKNRRSLHESHSVPSSSCSHSVPSSSYSECSFIVLFTQCSFIILFTQCSFIVLFTQWSFIVLFTRWHFISSHSVPSLSCSHSVPSSSYSHGVTSYHHTVFLSCPIHTMFLHRPIHTVSLHIITQFLIFTFTVSRCRSAEANTQFLYLNTKLVLCTLRAWISLLHLSLSSSPSLSLFQKKNWNVFDCQIIHHHDPHLRNRIIIAISTKLNHHKKKTPPESSPVATRIITKTANTRLVLMTIIGIAPTVLFVFVNFMLSDGMFHVVVTACVML